ncbi:MAG: hypothetical protein GEU87_10235 [Alphaproteobacteria bacterium]|nr:hypothetical protein [Alphaproteobacteria bacterium]
MEATEANESELYPEETVLDEVEAVIELFAIGAKRRREEFRKWLVRIVEEDEDSAALAVKAQSLYSQMKELNKVRLIDLACGYWPAGPLVCGALLHEVLGDREKIDILFDHAGEDILRWFRRVPLGSLMSEEERRALGALPATIDAYHEAAPSDGRVDGQVQLGPYWIMPQRGAAPRLAETPAETPAGQAPARLVKARVPRSSVLAYYSGAAVPALIVDYRRVASVEIVGGKQR